MKDEKELNELKRKLKKSATSSKSFQTMSFSRFQAEQMLTVPKPISIFTKHSSYNYLLK
jgi:hypothetical protein